MTIYNPLSQKQRTLFIDPTDGVIGLFSNEKVTIDLANVGFIDAEVSVTPTAPTDTNRIWIETTGTGPQADPANIKIHNGTAWVTPTPALFLRLLAIIAGGGNGANFLAGDGTFKSAGAGSNPFPRLNADLGGTPPTDATTYAGYVDDTTDPFSIMIWSPSQTAFVLHGGAYFNPA